MKRIKRKSNPEYEYVYFIFRPVTTVAGDSDIEVLSEAKSEDNEIAYRYARDYERQWSELTFETKEEALEALIKFKKRKQLEYGYSRRPNYIVNPDLVGELYLNWDEFEGKEVLEVVGVEHDSYYLRFVAYIGHHTIKISDD